MFKFMCCSRIASARQRANQEIDPESHTPFILRGFPYRMSMLASKLHRRRLNIADPKDSERFVSKIP